MNKKLLVIVPCAQAKVWKKEPNHGPTKAKFAYKSPPFAVNRKFAERFSDKWVILSAKYGFIEPDFVIPKDYNVTFKKPSTNPINLESLRNQVLSNNAIRGYGIVIALGGRDYTMMVQRVFMDISNVVVPTKGMTLFDAMHKVSLLSKLNKKVMLNRIGVSDE